MTRAEYDRALNDATLAALAAFEVVSGPLLPEGSDRSHRLSYRVNDALESVLAPLVTLADEPLD